MEGNNEVLKVQIENNRKDIEDTNKDLHNFKSNVYERFKNVENNISTIDKSLSEKMVRLETTYELTAKTTNEKIEHSSKSTNEKIDKMNKKLDGFLEKKDTRNYDWIKIIGTVILTILIAYVFKKVGIY